MTFDIDMPLPWHLTFDIDMVWHWYAMTFDNWHLFICHDICHLTLIWHLTLICHDIWHLTFDIWHDMPWHLTFDISEGSDSTGTDACDIGTILSHFHWWILRLSAIPKKITRILRQCTLDYPVMLPGFSDFGTIQCGLRDASASKNG